MDSPMPGAAAQLPDGAPPAAQSRVLVHPDSHCLALAVATLFTEAARRAVKERGRFAVALAGGSTPRHAYELLAGSPFAELVPWEKVHVFWGDERCVDPSDSRSNERMARETLLNHVPIPGRNVHPMRCGPEERGVRGESRPTLERLAADDYERLLRSFFLDTPRERSEDGLVEEKRRHTALDLVLLGLGPDGHTASLFPGSEALKEERRWVAVTPAGAAGGDRLPRVTLTALFINQAALVVFMVGGRDKAAIVREVLEGPVDPLRLPAQSIRVVGGHLRWHLDDDSASLLANIPAVERRGTYGSASF